MQAGRDAQAAAKQAADSRAEALASSSEAGAQRAVAEAADMRSVQLQGNVKRLTEEVEKWRAAAQSTQDRLRSSSVAAGAADGDAREAKDALHVRRPFHAQRAGHLLEGLLAFARNQLMQCSFRSVNQSAEFA